MTESINSSIRSLILPSVSNLNILNEHEIILRSKLTAIGGKESPIVQKLALSRYCSEEKKILDYGAGKGRNGLHLLQLGHDVIMYDINSDHNCITSLFPKQEFDIVLLNYVLNVILKPTRLKVLDQIKSVCHPKTWVLVEVRGIGQIQKAILKNAKNPSTPWKMLEDGYLTSRGTFQKGYQKGELQLFLEEQGFKTVEYFVHSTEKTSILVTLK